MKLNLQKPIVFFDLETTGLSISNDRIIEFAFLKIMPDGSELSGCYRINPTIPISAEATAITGITDADVADCKTFKELAPEIFKLFQGSDIAGYNSNNFDIPLLAEELLRVGYDLTAEPHRLVDVQVIYHKKEKRNLSAAYKFYCNKDLEGAHAAENDIKATYEVLKSQLDRYPDLQNDVDFLSKFTTFNNNVDFAGRMIYDQNNRIIFNFGKHKGKLVEDVFRVEPSYYSWLMNGDFPLNTKNVFKQIKDKMAAK